MSEKAVRSGTGRAEFIFSLPRWREDKVPPLPMVVVCGRSNVGKSSFINMLVNRKNLARTSSTPGRTQLLNFFQVDGRFLIVDVPGYGYAKAPKEEVRRWTENLKYFVRSAENIALVIQLLDIRREPSPEDHAFAALVRAAGKRLFCAATKADKEPRGRRTRLAREIEDAMGLEKGSLAVTSSADGAGRQEMWKTIGSAVATDGERG